MVSRSIAFGPTALGTADTETTVGSAYTFATSGRIREIRWNADQATVDIGNQGILYLKFKKLSGPFEFVVGMSAGKLTTGEVAVPATSIPVDIPYDNGEQVTVSCKATEILADVTVSLTCVE